MFLKESISQRKSLKQLKLHIELFTPGFHWDKQGLRNATCLGSGKPVSLHRHSSMSAYARLFSVLAT